MNNFYIIPNNKESVFDKMILPLENYSIGFDVYYNVKEINELASKYEVSVIINKFLHKDDISNIEGVLNKLQNVKYFFVEDLGLVSSLDKSKVVVSQNHILNNYDAVNMFYSLGYSNVLINNDLTIKEITEIKRNTNSNLFIYYIGKLNLMYSKRHLIDSFCKHKNCELCKTRHIEEKVSKHKLIIKEEDAGTCIFNDEIFSGSKYIKELDGINLIVNLSNISKEETDIILNHMEDLHDVIKVDNYFLENKIEYKVGEL